MHEKVARIRFIGMFIVLALLMTLSSKAQAVAQDVAVIANKNLPVASLRKSDVKKIFLGEKTQWDSGEKIVFALWANPQSQKTFLKKYAKKSLAQYKNYWKKRVFTGKGSMPPSFGKEDDVIKFVGETSGAISFAPAGVQTDTVKIIEVK